MYANNAFCFQSKMEFVTRTETDSIPRREKNNAIKTFSAKKKRKIKNHTYVLIINIIIMNGL